MAGSSGSRGKHMIELALQNILESLSPQRIISNYNFEVVSNVIIEEILYQEKEHKDDERENKSLAYDLEQEVCSVNGELDNKKNQELERQDEGYKEDNQKNSEENNLIPGPSKRAENNRGDNKHLRLKETTMQDAKEGDDFEDRYEDYELKT